MWQKILFVIVTLAFAFAILLLSVFRTAAVKYELSGKSVSQNDSMLGEGNATIDYYLPYPGRVLPDNPFWFLKALRDKLWFSFTTNPTRKAELLLLLADKRLGSAKILFEKGKNSEALSTLTKAEKYLEAAMVQERENRKQSLDTSEFLVRIAKASLKHYQLMQYIEKNVPDDIKPAVIVSQEYPKKVYEQARNSLLENGLTPPENPFGW
ncbi:hypothetical protein A2863_04605 [Candidatus Woesebacteria bacterium RIFCSPHIGHO2_01_FULL_38_9b]|uniref:DUF5667 domain-containing protein n=1 Tax=Candidatus Woesebacteria bacterium RIFCSPHIGHO2_01_FULL_38_9b TaxID=1802493 RepID=A0A1F7Y486_9BACT|nr:MAG: hypothetical protein A2863_04605 [Candidatus Woesebacteria bacterium RIFCSPHIGHO2_01_FULL_38_9b]